MTTEAVCTDCPLNVCDENSLWCIFRFLTQPNVAQQALIKKPLKLRKRQRSKKQYNAAYYRANIAEKKAYDAARYRARKQAEQNDKTRTQRKQNGT